MRSLRADTRHSAPSSSSRASAVSHSSRERVPRSRPERLGEGYAAAHGDGVAHAVRRRAQLELARQGGAHGRVRLEALAVEGHRPPRARHGEPAALGQRESHPAEHDLECRSVLGVAHESVGEAVGGAVEGA